MIIPDSSGSSRAISRQDTLMEMAWFVPKPDLDLLRPVER